jgi:hypothetical protein
MGPGEQDMDLRRPQKIGPQIGESRGDEPPKVD